MARSTPVTDRIHEESAAQGTRRRKQARLDTRLESIEASVSQVGERLSAMVARLQSLEDAALRAKSKMDRSSREMGMADEVLSRVQGLEVNLEMRMHRLECLLFASDFSHFQRLDAMIAAVASSSGNGTWFQPETEQSPVGNTGNNGAVQFDAAAWAPAPRKLDFGCENDMNEVSKGSVDDEAGNPDFVDGVVEQKMGGDQQEQRQQVVGSNRKTSSLDSGACISESVGPGADASLDVAESFSKSPFGENVVPHGEWHDDSGGSSGEVREQIEGQQQEEPEKDFEAVAAATHENTKENDSDQAINVQDVPNEEYSNGEVEDEGKDDELQRDEAGCEQGEDDQQQESECEGEEDAGFNVKADRSEDRKSVV